MSIFSIPAGPAGLIASDSASETTQSSGGAAVETLKTLTLPAGTLAADGDIVVFHAGGRCGAAVGPLSRQVLFLFGSAVFSAMVMATNGSELRWTIEVVVIRTGAATQTVFTTGLCYVQALSLQKLRGNAAIALAAPVVCLLQGQDLNSENKVGCDFYYVVNRVV